jgi:hypothetical protein
MAKNHILVPTVLDLHSSLEFSIVLSGLTDSESFVFDFRNTERVEPFAMLLVSSEIMGLRKKYPNSSTDCINFEHMTVAREMGFFQAFGFDTGTNDVATKSDLHVIPLTIFDCETLIKEAAMKGIEVGDEVEAQSREIARMLCRESQGDVYDTLSYSIREIMRNAVEHSQAKRFGICAQHWPSQNKVEVAVLDRGIGLRKSLSVNPHLDASDDKRAINYALMPAVSGKAFKGSRVKQHGPWANSGFGLYMTNRICRNGGTFFIASGNAGMLLTKKEGKRYFDCMFDGTAIRMVMRTDQIESLRSSLDKYRKEGYEIQSKYKEIVRIDPSSASLMLSDDFDLSTWDRLLIKLKKLT